MGECEYTFYSRHPHRAESRKIMIEICVELLFAFSEKKIRKNILFIHLLKRADFGIINKMQ